MSGDYTLAAALGYAERGWRVVPILPGQKRPALNDWVNKATTDTDLITEWWEAHTDHGIGIVTGKASGIFVLDVDGEKGAATLRELDAKHGKLPPTFSVKTGNGYHFYFWYPDFEIRNDASKRLGPGIDIRGEGGQVVAPPTIHPNGTAYEAEVELPVAPAPAWLLELLHKVDVEIVPAVALPSAAATAAVGTLKTIEDERPGDRFASENEWADLLENDGATFIDETNGCSTWYRPGKTSGHLSATVGYSDADTLHVFTTNWPGLDADTSYTKFGYYAATKFGGDFNAAATALAKIEESEGMAAWSRRVGTATPSMSPSPVVVEGDGRRTDVGNSERFVNLEGLNYRFEPGLGWLTWGGTHWQRDLGSTRKEAAKRVARSIYTEAATAATAGDTALATQLAKWAKQSESEQRLNAMISLASSDPQIVVTADQFDAEPSLLNCQNGTVNLRTGELRPHDRSDLMTKIAGASYDPDAPRPEWDKFIDRITGGDVELADYIQTAIGYAATGEVVEHVVFVAHGGGSNGKSTCLNAVLAAFGDYGMTAEPDLLLAKRNETHPTGVADLFGRRLAVSSESDNGRRLDEGLVKRITGGDNIKARYMRADFFEFRPTHTIILQTNHLPQIRGTDEGIWRRVRKIPFAVTIEGGEVDHDLGKKLEAELGGVLAWIVEGANRWYANGLPSCDAVDSATREYRTAEDSIGEFLSDFHAENVGDWATSAAIVAALKAWCEARSERPVTQKAFYAELKARGYGDVRRHAEGKRVRTWEFPPDFDRFQDEKTSLRDSTGQHNGKMHINGLESSREGVYTESAVPAVPQKTRSESAESAQFETKTPGKEKVCDRCKKPADRYITHYSTGEPICPACCKELDAA